MDWYSFFIINSFLGGYSVSAVGKLSDNLPIRGKQYLAINSDIVSNSENLIPSDNVGTQPEENQTAENNSEDWEETGNESQLTQYEQDLLDSFGGYGDYEEYYQNEMPSRLTRDFVGGGGSSGGGGASLNDNRYNELKNSISNVSKNLQGNIDKNTNRIGSVNSRLQTNIDSLSARVDGLSNGLNTAVRNLQANIDRNTDRIGGINASLTARIDGLSNGLNTAVKNLQGNIDKNTNRINGLSNGLDNSIKNLQGNIDTNTNRISVLRNDLNTNTKTLQGNIDKNTDRIGGINLNLSARIDGLSNGLSTAVKNLQGNIDTNTNRISVLRNDLNFNTTTLQSNIDKNTDRIGGINSNLMALISNNGSKITVNNNRIDDLQKQIDNLSFNWSDVGIITALGLIKDSIDNFKDMFVVNTLTGLDAHEGIFTRMIKSQFISLKNHLTNLNNSQLDSLYKYFGIDINGEVMTPKGVFAKFLGDQIYKIRYTTISEFDELKTFIRNELTSLLTALNTSNIWLNSIYDELKESLLTVKKNQVAIGDWLQKIFDKPIGTVTTTPFDFNRLEQILKKMSLGEIVNEAGTNFWDFMKSLVDNLGDILGKAIDGLVAVVEKILDILDGLVDTILGLVIPKNWDFLDKGFGGLKGKFDIKFKLFLDLGGLVKDLFKPTDQDFLKALSFTWFGVDFDFTQSQSSLDIYVPKFRLAISVFIWAITAIYIYRKITGTGDVINDS